MSFISCPCPRAGLVMQPCPDINMHACMYCLFAVCTRGDACIHITTLTTDQHTCLFVDLPLPFPRAAPFAPVFFSPFLGVVSRTWLVNAPLYTKLPDYYMFCGGGEMRQRAHVIAVWEGNPGWLQKREVENSIVMVFFSRIWRFSRLH